MKSATTIKISTLREEFLQEVVRIHRLGLGYSVNSCLGDAHLALLYRTMKADPGSFVHVALVDGKPVGAITGTLDEDALKSRMLKAMPLSHFLTTGVRILRQPRLIVQILQGMIIGRPVYYQDKQIPAMVSSVVVDPHYEGRGVARALLASAERFFLGRGHNAYHLDTKANNERSRRLYEYLGFVLVYQRLDSVVLVRRLGEPA